MNEVKIFENSEFGAIRTVTDRVNSVWFCGSDVAKALGYERGAKAVADHIDSEDNEAIEKGTVELVIPDKLEREKKSIDEGKVMALYKAKWSQKKIADEMGCSQSKISQIIRAHKK